MQAFSSHKSKNYTSEKIVFIQNNLSALNSKGIKTNEMQKTPYPISSDVDNKVSHFLA